MDKRYVIPGLYRVESERTEFVSASPEDFTHNGSRILTVADPGPPATPITLAAIGSSPNANAATFVSNVLRLQPADPSFGGVVTTGAQTFAGLKTFSNGISANGLVTGLSAIGATPNANGASVSSGNLSLQPANVSFGGVVTTGAQSFSGAKTFSNGLFLGSELQNLSVYREIVTLTTIRAETGTIPDMVFLGGVSTPKNQIPIAFIQVGKAVTVLIPEVNWTNIDPLDGFSFFHNSGQPVLPPLYTFPGTSQIFGSSLVFNDSFEETPGNWILNIGTMEIFMNNYSPTINIIQFGCPSQMITYHAA